MTPTSLVKLQKDKEEEKLKGGQATSLSGPSAWFHYLLVNGIQAAPSRFTASDLTSGSLCEEMSVYLLNKLAEQTSQACPYRELLHDLPGRGVKQKSRYKYRLEYDSTFTRVRSGRRSNKQMRLLKHRRKISPNDKNIFKKIRQLAQLIYAAGRARAF